MFVVVPPAFCNILLATAPNAVCFDVIFSHGECCYCWHGLLTSGPPVNMCKPQLLVLLLVGRISFM